MTGNHGPSRWAVVLTVLLFGAVVGVMAYNAGMSNGLAQTAMAQGAAAAAPAQGAVAPYPYPYPYPYAYGWHRPWGFGFGFPFLFIAIWFLLLRGLWWGGRWRRHWYAGGPYGYHRGPYDAPSAFDEWHHRAHERMKETPPADDPGRGR